MNKDTDEYRKLYMFAERDLHSHHYLTRPPDVSEYAEGFDFYICRIGHTNWTGVHLMKSDELHISYPELRNRCKCLPKCYVYYIHMLDKSSNRLAAHLFYTGDIDLDKCLFQGKHTL